MAPSRRRHSSRSSNPRRRRGRPPGGLSPGGPGGVAVHPAGGRGRWRQCCGASVWYARRRCRRRGCFGQRLDHAAPEPAAAGTPAEGVLAAGTDTHDADLRGVTPAAAGEAADLPAGVKLWEPHAVGGSPAERVRAIRMRSKLSSRAGPASAGAAHYVTAATSACATAAGRTRDSGSGWRGGRIRRWDTGGAGIPLRGGPVVSPPPEGEGQCRRRGGSRARPDEPCSKGRPPRPPRSMP